MPRATSDPQLDAWCRTKRPAADRCLSRRDRSVCVDLREGAGRRSRCGVLIGGVADDSARFSGGGERIKAIWDSCEM